MKNPVLLYCKTHESLVSSSHGDIVLELWHSGIWGRMADKLRQALDT